LGRTDRSGGPLRRRLLQWFDRIHRDLPWRRTRDPYRIWLSETMLQQTRVEVVRPRYLRFLERFPDLTSLAAAPLEDVLAEWSGLGYYTRARNLHRAAGLLVREHNGVFPREPTLARKLPGVGVYTAHAVLSMAYSIPLAVVDGNVRRVVSRLKLLPIRPSRLVQEEADRLLDHERPGDWNQAVMELGAIVCSPIRPRCESCPVRTFCRAYRERRTGSFPQESSRPTRVRREIRLWIHLDRRDRIWLVKRTAAPLKGLWMIPWTDDKDRTDGFETLGFVSHAIMNHTYRCQVLLRRQPRTLRSVVLRPPGRWIDVQRIGDLPHSSLLDKALRLLRSRAIQQKRSGGPSRSARELTFQRKRRR